MKAIRFGHSPCMCAPDRMMSGKKASGEDRSDRRPEHFRGEHPLERADRNMLELLQELRVAQIGVQILFAGLITVTFTERFTRVDTTQRWIYVAVLLLTTVCTGLLIAPAAVHRMSFGMGMKPQVVRLGHRLFQVGLAMLALTLSAAVLLVLDVTLGRMTALALTVPVLLVLVGLWFVLPLPAYRRAARAGPGTEDRDGPGVRPSRPVG